MAAVTLLLQGYSSHSLTCLGWSTLERGGADVHPDSCMCAAAESSN